MKKYIVLLCILAILTGCTENIDDSFWTDTMKTTESVAPAPSEPYSEPPVQTEPVRPDEPTRNTVSFLACGDNMVFYGNVRDAASQSGPYKYNFAQHYKNVKDIIASADISMINQETLMSDKHPFSYYPRFNGPQDMGRTLVDTGFDVIGIANNHMLDKDWTEEQGGLLSTIDFWKEQPVTLIGGYTSEEDSDNIRIIEKNGIKIAFLAYTEHTNGNTTPEDKSVFIPYLSEELVKRQITEAKSRADFVIVSAHWGEEYTFTPNNAQISYAQIMTDAGADAIIGHHPHVIQPIKWLTAPDGSKTLCVYSLGNFVAEQANDYNMLGGMISFNMVKEGDSLSLEAPVFTPTVYYFNTSFYKNQVFLLSQFTDDLASSHGISNYENTITTDVLNQYLSNTISKEFLAQ